MMTNNNPSLNSTAESIYIYNADDIIADQYAVPEKRLSYIKKMNERLAKLTEENNSMTNEIARLRNLLKDNGIKEN